MAENNTPWVDEDKEKFKDLIGQLEVWFTSRAIKEARLVAPKAIEYGSASMITQGRGLAALAGREINDQDAFELAVWDMVRLKLGRWTEAVMHGKPVSDDTLLDIGLYVAMAQRNRSAGSWPGFKPEPEPDTKAKPEPPTVRTIEIGWPNKPEGNPFIDSFISPQEEQPEHPHRVVNPNWELVARGALPTKTYKIYRQWDLISTITGVTDRQLVQQPMPVPDTGYYHPARVSDPHCSGYHTPDNGYCLRNPNTTQLPLLFTCLPRKKG